MTEPVFAPRKIMPASAFVPAAGATADISASVKKDDHAHLAQTIAKCLATPDGQVLLEHLLDVTLRADFPSPAVPSIDWDMNKMAAYALRRGGQNSVVQHLLSMAAQGNGENGFSQRAPLK